MLFHLVFLLGVKHSTFFCRHEDRAKLRIIFNVPNEFEGKMGMIEPRSFFFLKYEYLYYHFVISG